MTEVAYFNDNDEWCVTKIDVSKGGELPEGFVKVNRDEPIGHYRPGKDLTGEDFIRNLENVNRRRVNEETPATTNLATTAKKTAQIEAVV